MKKPQVEQVSISETCNGFKSCAYGLSNIATHTLKQLIIGGEALHSEVPGL